MADHWLQQSGWLEGRSSLQSASSILSLNSHSCTLATNGDGSNDSVQTDTCDPKVSSSPALSSDEPFLQYRRNVFYPKSKELQVIFT